MKKVIVEFEFSPKNEDDSDFSEDESRRLVMEQIGPQIPSHIYLYGRGLEPIGRLLLVHLRWETGDDPRSNGNGEDTDGNG